MGGGRGRSLSSPLECLILSALTPAFCQIEPTILRIEFKVSCHCAGTFGQLAKLAATSVEVNAPHRPIELSRASYSSGNSAQTATLKKENPEFSTDPGTSEETSEQRSGEPGGGGRMLMVFGRGGAPRGPPSGLRVGV